jgi:predicted transcriptional regulator
MSAVVRLDEDMVEEIDRRADASRTGRSEVVRDALAALAGSLPSSSSIPERGRVNLVVPVRAESIAWLDELARGCKWTRDHAARQALSEGRHVLELKLTARTPDGGRPTPKLRVVPGDPVPAANGRRRLADLGDGLGGGRDRSLGGSAARQ